jgi:hypothetical protein
MQTVTCEVLLSGDLGNTVIKHNVSVPEIVILTAIHGIGSVANIKLEGTISIGNPQELKRLTDSYGRDVVAKVFPGSNPILPKLLVDIGIDNVELTAEEPKVSKKSKIIDSIEK